MIPIYLSKKTIKSLNKGIITLKSTRGDLSIDDYLMYNLARSKYRLSIYKNKDYAIKKGDKVIMKADKNKVVDYNDVLADLNEKESVFFLLYNSINYVNEKFGISTYLNEDLCYLLAFVKEEEYPKFGEFVPKTKIELEMDGGYDRIKHKAGNTLGLFKFHGPIQYTRVHKNALAVLRRDKIKQANTKLVEFFIGDTAYIKELIMKTLVDIVKNSTSEKSRIESSKVLGNWLGIENNTTNTKVSVILDSIKVADSIPSEEEEF